MNQAVITFTNSTARASAITSPVEGMVTYLADTDTYQFWNGSAWTNLVSSTVGTGNAIINGAFEINQRGFTSSTAGGYGFDRWNTGRSGGTVTASSETFTLGAAPVAGIEAKNFQRVVTSGQSAAGDYAILIQPIEGVRSFAGQTVTVSFYAKAGSGTPKVGVEFYQSFGGGSSAVSTSSTPSTISTSWARYSVTVAVPSIAGKTIGINNNDSLQLTIWFSGGSTFDARSGSVGIQNNTFDIWGVQVESGSTATPFRRNADSLAGELAACQRYYTRFNSTSAFGPVTGTGQAESTTRVRIGQGMPTTMRNLNSISWGNIRISDGINSFVPSSVFLSGDNGQVPQVVADTTGMTAFRPYWLQGNNNTAGFLAIEGEL
jgi:hypothetical protein